MVANVLLRGPKDGSQGTVDRVSEVGKNALQTLEAGVTDAGLVLCVAEAQDAMAFRLSRVACRASRVARCALFTMPKTTRKKLTKTKHTNTHFLIW